MTKSKRKTTLYCSFCRKDEHAVEKLIGGPGVYICDACVCPLQQDSGWRVGATISGLGDVKR